MRNRPFDCILIDFYGTIAAGDREAVEATCKTIVRTLGLPITSRDFAIRWGERYFETVGRSSHDSYRTLYQGGGTGLREMLAPFGRSPDPTPFLVELEEYGTDPPVYDDAVEFLRELDLR